MMTVFTTRLDGAPKVSRANGSIVKARSGITAVSAIDRLSQTACSNAHSFMQSQPESTRVAAPVSANVARRIVQMVCGLRTVMSHAHYFTFDFVGVTYNVAHFT